MTTQLDQSGFDLLAEFEGLRLCPYLDQVGIPTIGYGSTYYANGNKVTMNDPCLTKQQCMELFNHTSAQYTNTVHNSTVPVLTQPQFNALFSLCYNIGTGGFKGSTVIKLVNQGIYDERLKDAFLMWDKADGKVLQDLVKRREKEYNIFVSNSNIA